MRNGKANFLILLLVAVLLAAPVAAQQKRQAPRKPTSPAEPAPTFDTLLSENGYIVYAEIRNVGNFVRASGFKDLLDPLLKLGEPPKEIQKILTWLDAHGETLASSRLMFASWPIQSKLPEVLIAVEFSSPEEARKFESELRRFMTRLVVKSTPAASPGSNGAPASTAPPSPNNVVSDLPYVIKQAGSLVLLSDKPVSLRDLNPRGSKLLVEDANFAVARNRFASESVFFYFDVKAIERQEQEQRKRMEEEQKLRAAAEAANPVKPEVESIATAAEPAETVGDAQPSEEEAPEIVEPEVQPSPDSRDNTIQPVQPDLLGPLTFSLWSSIFGGQTKWPDAVSIALTFEDEGYVLRALILNPEGDKPSAIPFAPMLASGPAIVPASPAVMPADTNLFVSMSLDYSQMYEAMVKASTRQTEQSRQGPDQAVADTTSVSPFAEYEKKLGLKLKDDILPLLGNEVAVAILKKQPQPTAAAFPSTSSSPSETVGPMRPPDQTPVIAIFVRDRESVRKLLPKVIEALGFKGASMFAQTERQGDTEITSYANAFSYALMGDFLVFTPDSAVTHHVVDAYLKGETLSSDSHFRNSTRWQPRQMQGQVYAGPDVINLYNPLIFGGPVNENTQNLITRMSPVIDPITYSLSNEGLGPLHELHVPKNLLMLMVAGMTNQINDSPIFTNESIARSVLQTVVSAEATFQSTKGNGAYGTLEELTEAGLISKDLFEKYGYRIELSVLSNKFEATATPIEYGKTGRQSLFVDESGVLRGGDHGGGAATLSDKPVE